MSSAIKSFSLINVSPANSDQGSISLDFSQWSAGRNAYLSKILITSFFEDQTNARLYAIPARVNVYNTNNLGGQVETLVTSPATLVAGGLGTFVVSHRLMLVSNMGEYRFCEGDYYVNGYLAFDTRFQLGVIPPPANYQCYLYVTFELTPTNI